MSEARLFVYGVTVEEWTRRHGIVPFSHPCAKCGQLLTTSIPFVEGPLYGFQAPVCSNGCHESYTAWVRLGCPKKHEGVIEHPPYTVLMDPMFHGLRDGTWPPKKKTKKELKAASSARVIPFRRHA